MSRTKKPKPDTTPSPEIEALYEQVYADPDDDGARFVLSDALIERGDPRGEFIALQLGRGRGGSEKKEWKLLRQFESKWLGPIAVSVSGPVFERGFLGRCRYITKRGSEAAIGAREWSTVRVVNVDGPGDVAPFLLSLPIRTWARKIEGLHGSTANDVMKSPELRHWRSLSIRTENVNGILKLAIATLSSSMPELRTLEIACDRSLRPDLVRDLFDAPLGRQLSELSLSDPESNVALSAIGATRDLFSAAREDGPVRIGLTSIAGSVALETRGEHAGHVAIGMVRDPSILASALEGLKGAPIRSIRILTSRPGGYYGAPRIPTAADMEALRKAAEKIGPVTMESIP